LTTPAINVMLNLAPASFSIPNQARKSRYAFCGLLYN